MYNFYAMGTADNPRTPVVFVHEFGHSFANTPALSLWASSNGVGIGVLVGRRSFHLASKLTKVVMFGSQDHCMMRDYAPFCPACSRAILQMIDYFTDKPIKH